MRRIAAMYQWSGGTDYRHTCYECQNLRKIRSGSGTVYKCQAYGNMLSAASDWKASYIACKHFNKPAPERGVMAWQQEDDQIKGQMSLSDLGIN